jgi:hypothetical protein
MEPLFVRAMQYRPGDSMLGRSFAFSEAEERKLKAKHLDAIQQFAQRDVGPDDVFVRGMYLTNTQRDFYYSRFTRDALEEQTEMIPGAPVMQGHDYRGLPDARFFASRVVRIEDPSLPKRDQYWTENLYYGVKDDEGDRYVRRVDLGVYREVSIGFRLVSTPCSICKNPIWSCAHIPGDVYEKGGLCEWGMEGITSVLEGSQVFRGGQKDTSNFIPEGYGGDGARSALVAGSGDLDGRMLVSVKRANASLGVGGAMSIEEFLATPVAQRAIGWGVLFAKKGERQNTQAVVCSKSRFSDSRRASRWVRDHDFRADKRKDLDDSFVFEQFAEAAAEPGSFRTIGMDDGVSAKVCRVKQVEQEGQDGGRSVDRTDGAHESFESWLGREAAHS